MKKTEGCKCYSQQHGKIHSLHAWKTYIFQFMNSSLDKLVSNLPAKAFKYTSEAFKNEQFKLMKRKGVYPCVFMDSIKKFDNTELPLKEDIYSILNNEHISDEDYTHAKNVWKTFKL